MICIDSTATLQAILGETATTQFSLAVTYTSIVQATAVLSGPYMANVSTNTTYTTPATLVPTPSSGVSNQLATLSARNMDNIPHVITIRTAVSTTYTTHVTATLAVGEMLTYEHGRGWGIHDSAGVLKTANSFLTGSIMAYGASSPPPGWLVCDGSSVLRADYPALYLVIGTTYGSADGTHFTLPDLKGRVPIGTGTGTAAGATAWSMSTPSPITGAGGEQAHVLSASEMPSHYHPLSYYGWSSGIAAHQHDSLGAIQGASASLSGSSQLNNGSPAGAGGAHNIMQPHTVVQFIIKT